MKHFVLICVLVQLASADGGSPEKNALNDDNIRKQQGEGPILVQNQENDARTLKEAVNSYMDKLAAQNQQPDRKLPAKPVDADLEGKSDEPGSETNKDDKEADQEDSTVEEDDPAEKVVKELEKRVYSIDDKVDHLLFHNHHDVVGQTAHYTPMGVQFLPGTKGKDSVDQKLKQIDYMHNMGGGYNPMMYSMMPYFMGQKASGPGVIKNSNGARKLQNSYQMQPPAADKFAQDFQAGQAELQKKAKIADALQHFNIDKDDSFTNDKEDRFDEDTSKEVRERTKPEIAQKEHKRLDLDQKPVEKHESKGRRLKMNYQPNTRHHHREMMLRSMRHGRSLHQMHGREMHHRRRPFFGRRDQMHEHGRNVDSRYSRSLVEKKRALQQHTTHLHHHRQHMQHRQNRQHMQHKHHRHHRQHRQLHEAPIWYAPHRQQNHHHHNRHSFI